MIREALASVARSEAVAGAVSRLPGARSVIGRVVAGESVEQALEHAADLADEGFWLAIEHTEHSDPPQPEQALTDLVALIDAVAVSPLAPITEISIRPEALGSTAEEALPRVDFAVAVAVARGLAVSVGSSAAIDQGELVGWFDEQPHDSVGITLAAALRRTEEDCARLAARRVRLVKGGAAHDGRRGAYRQTIEVDKSYVRGAKRLLHGTGEASFATHDPRLVEILQSLARRYDRAPDTYEFAFYLGRMEGLQDRLLRSGERVRLYVPFGPAWFERLVGGLAEQRSSIGSAVRSLLPGS